MNETAYARVHSVEAALSAIRRFPNGMFIAGGTTVVDLMREGVFEPQQLIDISSLPLREIQVGRDVTTIGAMVSNSDLAWHPAVQSMFPVVTEALLAGASPQIRNMASIGGNLLQRTRCPYFRELSQPCNKRVPGTGCAALTGYNRSHAILGGSDQCVATHASDFAVALTVLDARIRIAGPRGERETPITEFYLQPGSSPERETALEKDELILAVLIPHLAVAQKSHYRKVRDRQSFEFALASAAVAVELDEGVIRDCRVALGGVGTVPWRSREAEEHLRGHRPDPDRLQQAAERALADSSLLQDNAFKKTLAVRTLVATLTEVTT